MENEHRHKWEIWRRFKESVSNLERTKPMKNQNIWYHGTSEQAWKQIQKEGKLWGEHKDNRRFTHLCVDKEEASMYGNVIIRVEYNPINDLDNNDFSPDAFELGAIKVTSPILMSSLRRV